MPSDSLTDLEHTADFLDALRRLLEVAHRNGIDVERAWECRTEADETPDWEVEVVRLRPDPADGGGE